MSICGDRGELTEGQLFFYSQTYAKGNEDAACDVIEPAFGSLIGSADCSGVLWFATVIRLRASCIRLLLLTVHLNRIYTYRDNLLIVK